jgi:hypothetical protein
VAALAVDQDEKTLSSAGKGKFMGNYKLIETYRRQIPGIKILKPKSA